MRKGYRLIIMFIVFLLPTVFAREIQGSDQLLCDPGLEQSTPNGTFPSSNCWKPAFAVGEAGAVCTSTAARTGSSGFWVYTGGEPDEWWSRPYQQFSTSPGCVHRARGWVRTPSGENWVTGSRACVRIEFYSSSDDHIPLYSKDSTCITDANTGWTEFSVTSDPAPHDAAYVRFICNLEKPEGADGQSIANFDDCFMEQVCCSPGMPSKPSPSDSSVDVATDRELSWAAVDSATAFDVYFGTSPNPPFKTSREETSYNPGILQPNTTYYWKVISQNSCGDTEGPVWQFNTIAVDMSSSTSTSSSVPSSTSTSTTSSVPASPTTSSSTSSTSVITTSSTSTSTLAPVSTTSSSVKPVPVPVDSLGQAYQHLYEVMDKYHTAFDVYTDQDAGGNHFIPSGWMGDWQDIGYNGNFCDDGTITPYQGRSCTQITYSAAGEQENGWAGIYWQHPENNWGDNKAGYDLTGATKLTFFARGQQGGELAEFKMGGINTPPYDNSSKLYQDSCLALSTGVLTLTDEWQEYSIDLSTPEFFVVYTDAEAGGNNRFNPSGWMGNTDSISFDDSCIQNPKHGSSCIKITYTPESQDEWAGVYWLSRENNWGDSCGYDLSGATKLTFYARGERGDEKAEFKVGGITGACPDTIRTAITTGVVDLKKEWQKYEINLRRTDLSNVIGGFCWVTNTVQNPEGCTIYVDEIMFDKTIDKDLNHLIGGFCWVAAQDKNPQGSTIYIDAVRYDKERTNELRFLDSYESLCVPEDVSSRNAAHLYDNALVMLAFMARGAEDDWERARILADSFVYAQTHDRYFNDGRLRNVYQSGDLADSETDTARLSGWWDYDREEWLEDKYHVSSYTGNLAWVMIALLAYYEEKGGGEYLTAAETLGRWIHDNCYDEDPNGYSGYTGGLLGWEPSAEDPKGQEKLIWKSTEHNLDLYVAFTMLYEATGNDIWDTRAHVAATFVEEMWNEAGYHFWTGTTGSEINRDVIPADAQTWGLMVLEDVDIYGRGIEWVEEFCRVDQCPECNDWKGFDFSYDNTTEENNRDGVWWEGTAHMCLAYQIIGAMGKSDEYLEELRRCQQEADNANGKGIVAACHDKLTTGFTTVCESEEYPDGQCPWYYYNRLHIGATAWYIFAELCYNPYWQKLTNDNCTAIPIATTTTITTTTTTIPWGNAYREAWGLEAEANLSLLRVYRDRVLAESEPGKTFVKLLYCHSQEILNLLLQNPALLNQTKQLVDELIPNIRSAVDEEKLHLTADQLARIQILLSRFETKAGAELQEAINQVKRNVREGVL